MSVLLLLVGIFGLIGIYRTNDTLKTVYADRTVPMWQLSEIQRLTQRTWFIISIGKDVQTKEFSTTYVADAEANLTAVNTLFSEYLQTYLTAEEKVLAERFRVILAKFEAEGLRPALAALKAGDHKEVQRIQMEMLIPSSNTLRINLQALTRLQLDIASREYDDAMERFNNIRTASMVSMLVGIVFAVSFGGFLVRSIIQSRIEFEQSLLAKRDLERQLQQSQKVQALGQLTGGIAHDFNNILSAILGYANLALSRHVPDKESKLAKYLREVVSSSERARDLIAKMLTFTRTQPSEDVQLISPALVVREVESMMSHSISSSIVLRSHIEDDASILMDAGELNQMLVNLIINARDALQGQGRIDIVVHKVQVNNQISLTSQRRFSGEFLAVDVSDTGTGIAPEHLPRLFDPFFTTKDVGKGTGLGLSMVQGIMMRAGGHILVQSTAGQGSSFRLLFPIVTAETREGIISPNDITLPKGQGQLVWLVDDEPALTGYLDELLRGWGYRTRSFNSPEQAWLAFKSGTEEIDLLVTDWTMPGLSGGDLVALMHGVNPRIPVIFCTGFSAGFDEALIPKLEQVRLLVKPLSIAAFTSALTELLA